MTIIRDKRFGLFVPVVLFLLAVYYVLPFLLKLNYWGIRDWDLFTTVTAVPVSAIVDYGQFPFWNPYLMGGNILFHHPEVAIFSPFLLLHLVLGPVVGLKIQVLICYFLGLWGSYRLGRTLGMSTLAGLLMAVGYFGSIHFALHFAEGHIPFTHFCFLPWFVHFVLQSVHVRRNIVWAGVMLALMILGNGAAVPLLYTGMFSFLLCALLSLSEKKTAYLINFVLAAMIGIGLSAVKFIPMVIYLAQNQWTGRPDESIPLSALGAIFFGLKHSLLVKNFPEQFWAWHEYGAYISPLMIVLAGFGLVARFAKRYIWLVLLAFFLALGLGNFGAYSPWAILSSLPGFSSARATGRSFQFVILAAAVLGGFGFDWLRQGWLMARKKWRFALYAVAIVIAGTNMVLAWPVMSEVFKYPPQFVRRSLEFSQGIESPDNPYKNFLANRGSIKAPHLSTYHRRPALFDPFNQVAPEYVISGRLKVNWREYTPNVITYNVTGIQAGEMQLGMGYDIGWRAADGRKLRDQQGLIVVPFDEGPQTIELRYRTPYFYFALAIWIIFVVAVVWLYRRMPGAPVEDVSPATQDIA